MILANACSSCSRLLREDQPLADGRGRCTAFPRGIPGLIWSGKRSHQAPYPGDLGKLYEPMPEDPDGLTSYLEAYEAMTGKKPKP